MSDSHATNDLVPTFIGEHPTFSTGLITTLRLVGGRGAGETQGCMLSIVQGESAYICVPCEVNGRVNLEDTFGDIQWNNLYINNVHCEILMLTDLMQFYLSFKQSGGIISIQLHAGDCTKVGPLKQFT